MENHPISAMYTGERVYDTVHIKDLHPDHQKILREKVYQSLNSDNLIVDPLNYEEKDSSINIQSEASINNIFRYYLYYLSFLRNKKKLDIYKITEPIEIIPSFSDRDLKNIHDISEEKKIKLVKEFIATFGETIQNQETGKYQIKYTATVDFILRSLSGIMKTVYNKEFKLKGEIKRAIKIQGGWLPGRIAHGKKKLTILLLI